MRLGPVLDAVLAAHAYPPAIERTRDRLDQLGMLTVPDEDNCRHVDNRKPAEVPDPEHPKPDDWDDRPRVMVPDYDTGELVLGDNPDYDGPWDQPYIENPDRWHSFMPNAKFSSDHVAIMASFAVREDNLCSTADESQWKHPDPATATDKTGGFAQTLVICD